jgi:hypothetical protein
VLPVIEHKAAELKAVAVLHDHQRYVFATHIFHESHHAYAVSRHSVEQAPLEIPVDGWYFLGQVRDLEVTQYDGRVVLFYRELD